MSVEKKRLSVLERTISRHLQGYVETAFALREAKVMFEKESDASWREWLAGDHVGEDGRPTRWGLSPKAAEQYVRVAELLIRLRDTEGLPLPPNFAVARSLQQAFAKNFDGAVACWRSVVEDGRIDSLNEVAVRDLVKNWNLYQSLDAPAQERAKADAEDEAVAEEADLFRESASADRVIDARGEPTDVAAEVMGACAALMAAADTDYRPTEEEVVALRHAADAVQRLLEREPYSIGLPR